MSRRPGGGLRIKLGAGVALAVAMATAAGMLLVVVGASLAVAGEDGPVVSGADRLAVVAAEAQREVEALRGWRFKRRVDVGVYTQEQMLAFVKSPFDETDEAKEKEGLAEASFRMIGLIPEDFDLEDATAKVFVNLAPPGIYNHHTKELRVLERAEGDYDAFSVRVTLVHELTHALDDQLFDLAKSGKEGTATSDEEQVWGAVVEGSGVTVQERYRAAATASGKVTAGEVQESSASAMEQMQAMADAPPYPGVFFARFPSGVRFLQRGARALKKEGAGGAAGGMFQLACVADAVRQAMVDPPRSSEQILHPEKYWDEDAKDEPVVVNDEDVEKMLGPLGLSVIHRDTLGELLCAVVTSPADKRINPMAMPMPGYWTTEGAKGWGGDRFYLLRPGHAESPGEGPRCGLWITLWDTTDDRDEFVAAYESHRSPASRAMMNLGSRAAVYFFGFNEATRRGVESGLQAAGPGLTRGGALWAK
ncbi:MAG TPA: hypothetical protein VM487_07535 [Phycisphaerae bacterium]|nr:hypothetical protein [Phycisphaerae bacterium]